MKRSTTTGGVPPASHSQTPVPAFTRTALTASHPCALSRVNPQSSTYASGTTQMPRQLSRSKNRPPRPPASQPDRFVSLSQPEPPRPPRRGEYEDAWGFLAFHWYQPDREWGRVPRRAGDRRLRAGDALKRWHCPSSRHASGRAQRRDASRCTAPRAGLLLCLSTSASNRLPLLLKVEGLRHSAIKTRAGEG